MMRMAVVLLLPSAGGGGDGVEVLFVPLLLVPHQKIPLIFIPKEWNMSRPLRLASISQGKVSPGDGAG